MVLSNEIKKELLQRYALNEISAVDLWCSLPLDVRRDRSFAQVFVDTSIQHRNPLDLEFALVLFATPELGANFDISPDMLCSLLDMDWHFSHEDIAVYLGKLRAKTSVECLYNAAVRDFQYLDYDETYQLARKCIEGLAQIGGAEALAKLDVLSNNTNKVIAAYADEAIERIT